MNRNADGANLDVDGGHARGREHRHLLAGIVAEVIEEGRFPRARPARDEDVAVRPLHDLHGLPELRIEVDMSPFHPAAVSF